MQTLFKFLTLAALFISFSSFQITPEHKKLYQVRLSMAFGDKTSDTEVYLFTAWNDPATAKLESWIEKVSPEIVKKSRLYFIDVSKDNTQDQINANLNFLINNDKKLEQYLVFRKTLLSKNPLPKTELPEDILLMGKKVFDSTYKNMKITEVPALLIYNLKTRQSTVYTGPSLFSFLSP